MGFDLSAKRPTSPAKTYYGARIEHMAFLRSAMLAAGVPEALVYKKFAANDNWLVTPRQSEMIAQKLTAWLRVRNLVVQLAEFNTRGRVTIDNLRSVHESVGNRKKASRSARRLKARSLMIRVDRKGRQSLREFATFCRQSGGFYVS